MVPTRLADLELRRSAHFSLLDTYYDTEALDLRRDGGSLRIRQSGGEGLPRLTLKGPSRKRSGAKARDEAGMEIERLPGEVDGIREGLAGPGRPRGPARLGGP